jgi:hypothetical protein
MIKNTLFSLFALLLVNLVSAQEEQTSSTQQYETAISTESPATGNIGEVDEFVGGGPDEVYSIDRGILILLSAGLLISTLYFRRKFVIR